MYCFTNIVTSSSPKIRAIKQTIKWWEYTQGILANKLYSIKDQPVTYYLMKDSCMVYMAQKINTLSPATEDS